MSNNTKEFLLTLAALLIVFFAGIFLGVRDGRISTERDSIAAGVGQYVITDTNRGTTAFQWVTNRVDIGR